MLSRLSLSLIILIWAVPALAQRMTPFSPSSIPAAGLSNSVAKGSVTSHYLFVAADEKVVVSGVIEYDGEPIYKAQVTATSLNNNEIADKKETDEEGRFALRLNPGGYEIRVSASGLPTVAKELLVRKGREAFVGTIDLADGGDLGTGTTKRVDKRRRGGDRNRAANANQPNEDSKCNCESQTIAEFYTGPFADDIKLKTWLNQKAERESLRLFRIIPLEDQTSILFFERLDEGATVDYEVAPISEAIDAGAIEKRAKLNKNKTFVGIHRINPRAYLIIFYGVK